MNHATDSVSIVLPSRMQGRDLLALGDQLLARFVAVAPAARKGAAPPPAGCPTSASIPPTVAASHQRFVATLAALRGVDAQRHGSTDTTAVDAQQTLARVASNGAWQVFHAWLGAWSQHDTDGQGPTAAEALALYGRIFPAPVGLRFISGRSGRRWTAMQVRMEILNDGGLTAMVAALGGERLLTRLRDTHRAYGRAFGYTVAKGEHPAVTVTTLPQFTAAKEALRDYVKKVAGSADPDIDRSEALAAWLLGPFHATVADFAATPIARPKPAPAAAPAVVPA